jgi:hypothetical protein
MTIAIENISKTGELDRKALTAVRGGNLTLVPIPPAPWEDYLPRHSLFPSGFPFPNGFPDVCPKEDGGGKVYPQ